VDDDRTLPSHFSIPGTAATEPDQHSLFSNNGPNPTGPNGIYFGSDIRRGQWLRTWVWLKGRTDNTGAFQLAELTASGVQQKKDVSNVQTLAGPGGSGTAPYSYEKIVMNAYGRQTTNSFPTFDDFYVAVGPGARARVEMGNMPTYSASTVLAITTPTSWSNSEITTTVHQGAFRAGQTAYLYVVGADGVVSERGYPITVGPPPQPALRVGDAQVAEGNGGATSATFTVSLSAASSQPVTVAYATANGSASSGSDYIASTGSLTFNPGVTSKTVTVQVQGDTLDEADETFAVNLSGPTNATIADGQGVGTITDDDTAPPSGATELAVASVSASADDGNVPANTLDGNLGTRWSAKGDGQWILYDLGAAALIDRVQIAFYLGDQRTEAFDVQVSTDGSSWATVFSGHSSGTTAALESFDFAEVSARYVRIVGHGNSQSDWNSLTEVEIWGWPGL
jgi:hypothetical protein